MRKNKKWFVLLIFCLLPFLVFLGLKVGSKDISYRLIFQNLFFQPGVKSDTAFIINELRLPRILLALLTGASLTLAGFIIQALIRNPLADPYILGASSGSALMVNLLYLGYIPVITLTQYTYPLFAFLGSLLSLLVVLFTGYTKPVRPNHLLLIGIALSSFFMALTGYLTYLSDNTEKLRSIVFWMFGGFDKADRKLLFFPSILFFFSLLFFLKDSRVLDVLLLGEEYAMNVGINVRKIRLTYLTLVSLLIGSIVSLSGPIGFVGLMFPHITRTLFGVSHRFALVAGILLGGYFLMICDLLTRIIYPPAGMPIGIITAFFGAPFFIYLIFNGRSFK